MATEKRGWTGDGQLTAHSAILNFQMLAFYENWWSSMLDQQRIGCLPAGEAPGRIGGKEGAPIRPHNWLCDAPAAVSNITLAQYQYGPISDVVPREQIGMGYFIGDPSWEVAATTIPYELLTQQGDVAYVSSNYDGPVKLLAWLNALGQANSTSRGLITWVRRVLRLAALCARHGCCAAACSTAGDEDLLTRSSLLSLPSLPFDAGAVIPRRLVRDRHAQQQARRQCKLHDGGDADR